MKKSLVALAALSAISAFADVDVSGGIKMYGVLDQAVMRQAWSSSASPAITNSSTGMFAAGATSRLGVRGNRDLGNGLTANIQTEIELFPDSTGKTGDGLLPVKNRGTFVGLTSQDIGSVHLGTQETTAYEVFAMDANGRVEYKPQVWRYTASDDTQDRSGNTVKFTTAEIAGFKLIFSKGYGEAGDKNKQKDLTSFGVKFHQGNLKAAYVMDSLTNTDGQYLMPGEPNAGLVGKDATGGTGITKSTVLNKYASTTTSDPLKRQIIAVSYDMGIATVNYIMAGSSIDGAGKLDTNTLGVRIPMDKLTVALSFGSGKYSTANGTTNYGTVADTTLGGYYNFDKSTSAYLLTSQAKHTNMANAQGYTNTTALGVQYKF